MTKQAGYQAVKRCGIQVVDGKIDTDIATLLYRRGTRRSVKSPAPPEPVAAISRPIQPATGMSYDEARRRREAAEASIAELKEAELRGELVRKAVVEREMASRLVALRESLEALADRLAALVAAESDSQACRRLLREEHRIALSSFATRLAAVEEAEEEVEHGGD
jgi:hypothetical protein